MTASRRDDAWLLSRLNTIWEGYFTDVPQSNPVFIQFGRYARLRFGSIKLDRRTGRTHITISGMFKEEGIPAEIVDHTIAHELCHYTHGFSSLHPRLHKYPHEGGVIKSEMASRGLLHLHTAYNKWVKTYRKKLVEYYRSGKR